MNDRDFDQVLDAFLDLGPETAPERVGAAARHEARETRQTVLPTWWPSWRFPIMNSTVRYGIGAVAVIVIALVSINYVAPDGLGGPAQTSQPTVEASPTPASTLDPNEACVPLDPGAEFLPVGRYCMDVGDASPVKITFDIPNTGWWPWVPNGSNDFAALLNGNSWGLSIFEIENVYTDPCHPEAGLLDPPIGSTVDDLVAKFREHAAFEVSNEDEVIIGGYTGQQLELSVTDDAAGCDDASWGVPPSGRGEPGWQMVPTTDRPVRIWVGDVDGTRLVIARPLSALPGPAEWDSGVRDLNWHAQDLVELDAIVESLRFND